MAQQVVTELVIDSNTSGADQFSQSMDKASDAAQKGTSSAASVSLAIAGVGVAAIGALAGLRAFVDYVGNQSQALVDMANHAELAGISTKEFQQTLFAARASGLTEKDFVSGIDKIGADITAASRGVTEFSKLFDANGLSIKNANGELKTTKQVMGDLAGLVENASPQIQQAIAKIAGVSASWVPFLKQGVEGIEEQKKAAADLGIIIDDNMIAKAKEFNAEWKAAVATWDLQFKASLASIMPLLIQAANLASTIIQGVGAISSSAGRLLTPDDEKSTSQLNDQINAAHQLREELEKIGDITQNTFAAFKARNLAGSLGLPEDTDLKTADAYIEKLTAIYDARQKLARVPITAPGTTVLPKTGDGSRDALETEIDRLTKHIAVTKADTESVGQSEAARAGLRAEATLYAAAERAGFTDLEQYADSFMKLREQVEATTQGLNKAKIAADIKFQKDTGLLSPQDVQIAQQLKSIYPDVATALSSVEAQAIRANNAVKEVRDTGQDFAKSFVQGLLQGKSAMEALTNAAQQLASKMADKAITDLFSGNFVQAGIEGAIAIGSAIFASDQKAKKELKDAQDAWAKMTTQVAAFNAAAAGVNFGPLTQELQSMASSFQTLAAAAHKAGDEAGLNKLSDTFTSGVVRVLDEFSKGAQTLTPVQTAIKAVNDEAAGLTDTINSLNAAGHTTYSTAGIAGAAQEQIKKVIAQFTDTITSSLTTRLNDASGKGYLNSAAALLKQRQADLVTAADLGNNPTMLAQISATFAAGAQKIIEDAGLVGSSFDDFIKLFPDFNGVVTQSATAIQAANDKFAALTKTITDYLNGLAVGSNSILSPQDQLGAAQSAFSRQLGLAQGGNTDAQSSITSYASTLLDQAKSYYASSSGYADIYRAVTSALAGLVGIGSQTSSATSLPSTVATGGLVGITPQVSQSFTGASNDNAAVAAQTVSLTQVFAQVGNAQIINLNDRFAELRADVKQLTKVMADRRALRPSDKAA